jgi:CheY-like chemotaxis protein
VDDQPAARALIRRLESAGVDVDEAENGAITIEPLERQASTDFLDISMLVMDGSHALPQERRWA